MKKISLYELESIINESSANYNEKRKIVEKAKKKSEEHPLQTDKMVYRIVVTGLVLIILTCLGSTSFLTIVSENPTPEIFMAIGSAAVGAIAGLLAPRPSVTNGE